MICHGIRIIGLTGGVASGKSSVARLIEEQGVPVIDADQLARNAVLPGSHALESIVKLFGREIIAADGTLDRKRVGEIVFADTDKLRQLEKIMHPEIHRLGEELIAKKVAAGHKLLVYMAPLLIEAGASDRVSEIWVVTVRPELQLERLMTRDAIGREAAQRIIDSQMPLTEKIVFGRILIDNSGTPQETRQLLADIWKKETGLWL